MQIEQYSTNERDGSSKHEQWRTWDVRILINQIDFGLWLFCFSNWKEKGGLPLDKVSTVYKHINENCPHLNILGLMTIGSYEQSLNPNEINLDFKVSAFNFASTNWAHKFKLIFKLKNLVDCREKLACELNVDVDKIELSMGMSHDFELAVSFKL